MRLCGRPLRCARVLKTATQATCDDVAEGGEEDGAEGGEEAGAGRLLLRLRYLATEWAKLAAAFAVWAPVASLLAVLHLRSRPDCNILSRNAWHALNLLSRRHRES